MYVHASFGLDIEVFVPGWSAEMTAAQDTEHKPASLNTYEAANEEITFMKDKASPEQHQAARVSIGLETLGHGRLLHGTYSVAFAPQNRLYHSNRILHTYHA